MEKKKGMVLLPLQQFQHGHATDYNTFNVQFTTSKEKMSSLPTVPFLCVPRRREYCMTLYSLAKAFYTPCVF